MASIKTDVKNSLNEVLKPFFLKSKVQTLDKGLVYNSHPQSHNYYINQRKIFLSTYQLKLINRNNSLLEVILDVRLIGETYSFKLSLVECKSANYIYKDVYTTL